MDQCKPRQGISLYESEGWARNFDTFVTGEMPDESASKGRFAGTKIARERDRIAGLDQRRNVHHQTVCGCLIGKGRRKTRAAGAGWEHRIIRLVGKARYKRMPPLSRAWGRCLRCGLLG